MRRVAWLTGVVGAVLVLLWVAIRWDGGLAPSTVVNAVVGLALVLAWAMVYRRQRVQRFKKRLGALQWLTIVVALSVAWWDQPTDAAAFLGWAGYMLLFASLAFLLWMGLVVFLAQLSRDIQRRILRRNQLRNGGSTGGRPADRLGATDTKE